MAVKGGYRYGDDPNVDQTGWIWWETSEGKGFSPPDEVPSGAKRQISGGGSGGRGGKRKDTGGRGGGGSAKGEATGVPSGGGGPAGGGKPKADGGDGDGATPMDVSADDMSRAVFGGGGDGSDSEWSAGGNDSDNGGSGTGGSGGGDTDSGGSGGNGDGNGSSSGSDDSDSDGGGSDSDDSDSEDSDSGGTDSASDDSGSGGSGGRSRGGGGRSRGGGGRGRGGGDSGRRKKYQSGKHQPEGRARVTRSDLIEILTTPSIPRYEASDKAHMAACRKEADEKKKKREGTAPRAGRTKYGIGSMPNIAAALGGLTDDSSGFPLKNGVFFDREKLEGLEESFNIAYFMDPKHIGVTLGTTMVEKGGRKLVVQSFERGEYTLEDGKTKMRQWELLKCQKGGSVTLDDARRRFILHLVTTQTIMKIHGAPFVRGARHSRMLWNIDAAIRRLEKDDGVELVDGEMDLSELKELKVRGIRDVVG